jgi:hypothetical protein
MAFNLSELAKRIELAKLESEGRNCVGTAIYLIGEQSEDEFIERRSVRMSRLKQIEEPQIGALAIWSYKPWIIFEEEVLHMGVVTRLNPPYSPKVTHRPDTDRPLIENQSCEEISEGYPHPAKFYVPKK